MNEHSNGKGLRRFLADKGFYIALVLCICVCIGSGWYLYSVLASFADTAQETAAVETVPVTQPEDSEAVSTPADTVPEDAASDASAAANEDAEAVEPVPEDSEPTADAEDTPAQETDSSAVESVEPTAEETPEPAQETAAPIDKWVWPVEGDVLAVFSSDALSYNEAMGDWRTHNGVDLAAEPGAQVAAAHGGTVFSVTKDPLLGTTVTIENDGLTMIYGNLAEDVSVSGGDSVETGQVIGTIGDTAAGENPSGAQGWLHFAMEKNGTAMDPMEYLSGS